MPENLNAVEVSHLNDDQLVFERGGEFDEETFLEVLHEAVATIEEAGVPALLMGGLASATHGRPRWTHDIDLFIRPQDAKRALEALQDKGFQVQETYPDWLFKGLKNGVLVDLIFRTSGDIYLDDEMIARSREEQINSIKVRMIAPEDLLIIKAIVHEEHLPRHWHDALGLIAAFKLDWDYVLYRAQRGARRVLALLLYAQSNDLLVPDRAIRSLYRAIYEPDE